MAGDVYTSTSGAGYRVLHQVGTPGGFASVFLVEDDAGESYALKRLRLVGLPAQMLLDEAEHLRRVQHRHVIRYRDSGTEPEAFLVMELADSGSLREVVGDALRRGRQLPFDVVLRWSAQLLRGLAAVHRELIHCDVKAGNVLLRGDVAKLADFGSARLAGQRPGVVRTAPTSKPPEGWLDDSACQPTVAYDLYGAGVVLHELATLRSPFPGPAEDDYRLQHLIMLPDPRELRPKMPRALEELILDLLRKDPARRPAAEDALRRLREAGA